MEFQKGAKVNDKLTVWNQTKLRIYLWVGDSNIDSTCINQQIQILCGSFVQIIAPYRLVTLTLTPAPFSHIVYLTNRNSDISYWSHTSFYVTSRDDLKSVFELL